MSQGLLLVAVSVLCVNNPRSNTHYIPATAVEWDDNSLVVVIDVDVIVVAGVVSGPTVQSAQHVC